MYLYILIFYGLRNEHRNRLTIIDRLPFIPRIRRVGTPRDTHTHTHTHCHIIILLFHVLRTVPPQSHKSYSSSYTYKIYIYIVYVLRATRFWYILFEYFFSVNLAFNITMDAHITILLSIKACVCVCVFRTNSVSFSRRGSPFIRRACKTRYARAHQHIPRLRYNNIIHYNIIVVRCSLYTHTRII